MRFENYQQHSYLQLNVTYGIFYLGEEGSGLCQVVKNMIFTRNAVAYEESIHVSRHNDELFAIHGIIV